MTYFYVLDAMLNCIYHHIAQSFTSTPEVFGMQEITLLILTGQFNISFITSPPEGVARYFFSPCLSVCLSVCLCVCPANILVFYFSAIRRDIDLKFIQYTYRVALKILTFIGQRSRSQGRYIAF